MPHYYQRSSGGDHIDANDGGSMAAAVIAHKLPSSCTSPPSSTTTSSSSSSSASSPHDTNPRRPTKDQALDDLCSIKRPLTFWPLLALIFYTSSGGPFGIEDIVSSVGPLLAIVGYLVFPLVWSIPEALLTAELSSAFPECAGCVAWVNEAFGHPSWGYMRGALSWLSGVMDNAIYPVLFVDYCATLDPGLALPLPRALLVISFTLLLTFLSYRGLDLAGRVAIGVCLASLLPFLILVVMGLFQLDLSRTQSWSQDPSMLTRSDWLGMLNLLFWNLNAFDSAASFAGEVRNPGWTYPRAMLSSIALIVASYVLPILVGTLATTIPYAEWKDGTFTEVGREVGGKWLAGWIVLSAAISNVGLFLAEMSSDAYQLMGMAELGLIPSVLGQKSRYGTPTLPILLSMVVVLGISLTSSFERIIVLVNFLYALAEIFEIAAFLLLRFEQPNLPRPYRIPVNNVGAVGIMFLPIVFIALVLLTATWQTWVVSLPLVLVVFASYFGMEYLKKRGLCQFYVSPPTPVAMETLDGEALERGREEAVGGGQGERTPLTGSPYERV